MNRMNKEQVLFLVALVILGAMGYFRFMDRATGRLPPSSKRFEWRELSPTAEVQFLDRDEGRYAPSGRNIFAPPRDWFALEPLRLELPPGLELNPVWPFPEPTLGSQYFNSFVAPAVDRSAAAAEGQEPGEGEEGQEPGAESAETGEDSGDVADPAAAAVSIDLGDLEEEDPEEALMMRYDWIKLKDRRDKIFGQILNEDKFKLLDDRNSDAIKLRRFVVRTEKWAETFAYERDRVEKFGFARTVANVHQIELRGIVPNAANINKMHDLARWCLEQRAEDPQAIEFAVAITRLAIEQDPLLGESYLLLADIHETAFDMEGKLTVLQEAMDRGIREPGVYARYGRYLERYGLDDKAEEAYRQGMNIRPGDAGCNLRLGGLKLRNGLHEEALGRFEEALRSPSLTPEMKVPALLGKAEALLALNRLTDAAQEAGRAIHLDTDNARAWVIDGCIAFAGGDHDGAWEAYVRAQGIEPDNAHVLTNLGATQLVRGETERALKILELSAEIDPFFSCRALAAAGFAHELSGDIDAALEHYNRAVQVEPDSAFALYLMGRFQRRAGDPEAAVATLRKALRLDGQFAAVIGELGHACLDMGKFEDAAFYFREHAKRGSEDYRSLFLQGVTHLKLGRIAEAESFFKKSADTSNKAPQSLNGLAMIYYVAGKETEALDTFARVLRLFPEDSEDPSYIYAWDSHRDVESHLRKTQWVDRFQRKEIKNGWEVVQRYGPRVFLVQNEVRFQGEQRAGVGGEMSMLRRTLSGKEFRVLEAEVKAGEEQQGRMGIFVGSYKHSSSQGMQPDAEIRFGVDHQGRLVYRVVDYGRVVTEWTEIEGMQTESGESVKLGIEVVNYEQGVLRLTADGAPVVGELTVKKLKKVTRNLHLGVFGEAAGGRSLVFTCGFARIVKTR